MALKAKLTKDQYEALSAHFKSEYKAVGDNFILDTDDNDDKIELKAAKDKEKADRKAAEASAAALKKQVDELNEQLADLQATADGKGKTELEKAQRAHEKEVARITADFQAKSGTVKAQLDALLIDGVAEGVAKDMFKFTPDIFANSLVKPRLKIGEKDGKPVTVAVGKDGADMSIEDLRKEILATPGYADILRPVGSASGGGANHGQGGGQGGGGAGTLTEQHQQAARAAGILR